MLIQFTAVERFSIGVRNPTSFLAGAAVSTYSLSGAIINKYTAHKCPVIDITGIYVNRAYQQIVISLEFAAAVYLLFLSR